MVRHVKAWILRALGTLSLLVSTGLILGFAAGGFSSEDRAADVSTADTLRHLLAGEGEPRMPESEGDLRGTFPVLPSPTRAEFDANLERSAAGGRFMPEASTLASHGGG